MCVCVLVLLWLDSPPQLAAYTMLCQHQTRSMENCTNSIFFVFGQHQTLSMENCANSNDFFFFNIIFNIFPFFFPESNRFSLSLSLLLTYCEIRIYTITDVIYKNLTLNEENLSFMKLKVKVRKGSETKSLNLLHLWRE